jgi:ATP-dependent RNA helicase RhlE
MRERARGDVVQLVAVEAHGCARGVEATPAVLLCVRGPCTSPLAAVDSDFSSFLPFGCDWPSSKGGRPGIHSKASMSFKELGLTDALSRAVADQGYSTPTPIQAQAIPAVLAGHDVLAAAQTGTGKTAGFVLPILQRVAAQPAPRDAPRHAPRVLILTPTRELAAQVEASVRTYGKYLRVTSLSLFGGVGLGPQATRLRQGVDILVATPGRLLDHAQQRNVDLSRVATFVLDEADRMLDMGFIPDVKRVIALLPRRRQTLLFSATFSDDIRRLAGSFLVDPRTIDVAPRNSTVEMIAQRIHPVDRDRKAELLAFLIGRHRWQQVLVFTRTKHGADKLRQTLERSGIAAVALHGNKSQGARTKALGDFKRGAVTVLVATDIAARGIDIDQLPHVVNYDLPNIPEDYVHRIGRTGRAGNEGEAVSLVCVDEHAFLRDIERLIKRTIARDVVPGFEPDPRIAAQPVFAQRGRAAPRPHTPAAHARGGRGRETGHAQVAREPGRSHAHHAPDAGRGHAHARAPAPRGAASTGTASRANGGATRRSGNAGAPPPRHRAARNARG